MTAIAQEIKLSPQKYLLEERKRIREKSGKFEFVNFKLKEMSGASEKHNRVASNLHILIGQLIWGTNYEICQSDLRVFNPINNGYVYPDLVIFEGEPIYLDDQFDTLTNPKIIIEVLSKSTMEFDKGEKFTLYRQIKSLKEYILVHQDQPFTESFYRKENDLWQIDSFIGLESEMEIKAIQQKIAFEKIYRKVKWENQ